MGGELNPRFPRSAELRHLLTDKHGRRAELLRDFRYIDKRGRGHCVPAGYITDGGSIPQFFWRLAGSPYTGALEAYIVHDWYCDRALDVPDHAMWAQLRKQADLLFREMLAVLAHQHGRKLPAWRREILYRGVRIAAMAGVTVSAGSG